MIIKYIPLCVCYCEATFSAECTYRHALHYAKQIIQNIFQSLSADICTLIPLRVTSWCVGFVFIWDAHNNTGLLICDIIFLILSSSRKLTVVPGNSSWLSLAPESSPVHRILPHHYTVRTETAASQHASCSCSVIGK